MTALIVVQIIVGTFSLITFAHAKDPFERGTFLGTGIVSLVTAWTLWRVS